MQWMFFGVLMALLPIVSKIIAVYMKVGTFNVAEILAQGELLLVASALCGAAVGELFGAPTGLKLAKIIVGGSTVLTLITASLCFAILPIASPASANEHFNKDAVEITSLVTFGFSFLLSALCIILSGI